MVVLAIAALGFVGLMIYLLISKLGSLGFLALIVAIFYGLTQLKKA